MSGPIEAIEAQKAISSAVVEQSRVETTQGAFSLGTGTTVDPQKATVASLTELRQKYPEMYNAFMLAFANQLRASQQRSNDRLIAELKKQRQR